MKYRRLEGKRKDFGGKGSNAKKWIRGPESTPNTIKIDYYRVQSIEKEERKEKDPHLI